MFQGFKQFILKGNVVELAVGVVMGVSFQAVVNSVVKGIITPMIGLIGGKPDFSSIAFLVLGNKFLVGDFLNALLSFLINAAVIYFFVVIPMNKLMNTAKKKPADPTEKKCPYCMSTVPVDATRCAFCTSTLKK